MGEPIGDEIALVHAQQGPLVGGARSCGHQIPERREVSLFEAWRGSAFDASDRVDDGWRIERRQP